MRFRANRVETLRPPTNMDEVRSMVADLAATPIQLLRRCSAPTTVTWLACLCGGGAGPGRLGRRTTRRHGRYGGRIADIVFRLRCPLPSRGDGIYGRTGHVSDLAVRVSQQPVNATRPRGAASTADATATVPCSGRMRTRSSHGKHRRHRPGRRRRLSAHVTGVLGAVRSIDGDHGEPLLGKFVAGAGRPYGRTCWAGTAWCTSGAGHRDRGEELTAWRSDVRTQLVIELLRIEHVDHLGTR